MRFRISRNRENQNGFGAETRRTVSRKSHIVHFNGLFFVYFRLFKHKIYRKNIGVGGIQTQIVVIEGEQADHLFTFTPPDCEVLLLLFSTSVLDETT